MRQVSGRLCGIALYLVHLFRGSLSSLSTHTRQAWCVAHSYVCVLFIWHKDTIRAERMMFSVLLESILHTPPLVVNEESAPAGVAPEEPQSQTRRHCGEKSKNDPVLHTKNLLAFRRSAPRRLTKRPIIKYFSKKYTITGHQKIIFDNSTIPYF